MMLLITNFISIGGISMIRLQLLMIMGINTAVIVNHNLPYKVAIKIGENFNLLKYDYVDKEIDLGMWAYYASI